MKAILNGKIYEWDEVSKAESHNISDRKLCLTHEWINASLRFEKVFDNGHSVSVSIEERHDMVHRSSLGDEHFGRKWGGGYGGIRFCCNCKLIDCIHFWEEVVDDDTWKSCEHEWGGGLTRSDNNNGAEWRCQKCGAEYRFMCGHGGSLYVCDPCYKAVTDNMIKECGTLEVYLSAHCSAPNVPVIKKCVHCERKIRVR